MHRLLDVFELGFSCMDLIGRELLQDPFDVHELLAVHCGELSRRHLLLVPS